MNAPTPGDLVTLHARVLRVGLHTVTLEVCDASGQRHPWKSEVVVRRGVATPLTDAAIEDLRNAGLLARGVEEGNDAAN